MNNNNDIMMIINYDKLIYLKYVYDMLIYIFMNLD